MTTPAITLDDLGLTQHEVQWAKAGYLLGRHPGAVRAWQKILGAIASNRPDAPWEIYKPWDRQLPACDEVPTDWFDEVDDSLYELAMNEKIKATMLLEIHRSWDKIQALSHQIALAVTNDQPEIVEESDWSSHLEWQRMRRALRRAFEPRSVEEQWLLRGVEVGEAMESCAFMPSAYEVPDFLSFKGLGSPVAEFLPVVGDVLRLWKNPISSLREHFDAELEYETRLFEFDTRLREIFSRQNDNKPLLVIDYPREELEFLGQRFSFADLPNYKVLLVLAESPGQPIPWDELATLAGCYLEHYTLSQYVSRLRGALRGASDAYCGKLGDRATKSAHSSFIISQRKRTNIPLKYKLDLFPSQIQIIR